MPNQHDIFVTGGHRYQVIRVADNTPIGASFATRHEAEEKVRQIDAEEYGWEYQPRETIATVEEEVSARTVQTLESRDKTKMPPPG